MLLKKKHTDTLIESASNRPQEPLEYKMNKQLQSFSFSPPLNLVEEGKWLLAVTSCEATNSVFYITDENNSFSITMPGHWESRSAEKSSDELNNLLELRSQNGIELHVKEVREKGNKKQDNENELSHFGTQKKTRYLKNQKMENTVILRIYYIDSN